jgi:hypothetical protein
MDDSTRIQLRKNPEATANIFSRIFFWSVKHFIIKNVDNLVIFSFMNSMLFRGARKQLQVEDMYEPLDEHDSKQATADLTKYTVVVH